MLFGMVCDRIGRTRTLMLTMLLYALGTAACASAPNIWVLALFRLVASLGIGGEWAAGASMVAETVPEERRVEAGALLYTAAPLGLFLATFVNHQVAGVWFAASPETSWRIVFLFGLVPALVAFVVRLFVREPERWQQTRVHQPAASMRDLFAPDIVGITRARHADGDHRADHVVELQRVHPDGRDRTRATRRDSSRVSTVPRRWRWSSPGRRNRRSGSTSADWSAR